MTKTPLSAALGVYDRTRPLLDGRVLLDRFELNFKALSYGEISAETFGSAELDVGEVSLGGLLAAIDKGNDDYVAIPAFLSMGFRHDAIYVRADSLLKRAEDLRGKRIGLPEFYGTTAVWLRGILQDLHQVEFGEITWVVGGVEKGKAPKPREHDASIKCDYVDASKTLEELLLDGDVDALMSHREPAGIQEGTIRRLWDDVEAAESSYFNETGIIPLLHLPVVKRELLNSDTAAFTDLYGAFLKSKDIALREVRQTVVFSVSLPSIGRAVDRATRLLGSDFWPYGVSKNRAGIETFLRYAHEQKLTSRKLSVEEVFANQ